MKRPVEIRTPPRDWEKVLKISYPFLREHGIGDLLLYGSQAMSVYMKTPLRSKDLDLVTSQMGPSRLESLRKELGNDPNLGRDENLFDRITNCWKTLLCRGARQGS